MFIDVCIDHAQAWGSAQSSGDLPVQNPDRGWSKQFLRMGIVGEPIFPADTHLFLLALSFFSQEVSKWRYFPVVACKYSENSSFQDFTSLSDNWSHNTPSSSSLGWTIPILPLLYDVFSRLLIILGVSGPWTLDLAKWSIFCYKCTGNNYPAESLSVPSRQKGFESYLTGSRSHSFQLIFTLFIYSFI